MAVPDGGDGALSVLFDRGEHSPHPPIVGLLSSLPLRAGERKKWDCTSKMLALYGCPISYPRGRHTIAALDAYQPPDVALGLSRTTMQWPPGDARHSMPPSVAEVAAFTQAASRALDASDTRVTIRTFSLSSDPVGCDAPRQLFACPEDDVWQTFLVLERTMVALDAQKCSARAIGQRDLSTIIDCLALTRDGPHGMYVVQYEA